MRLLPKDKAGKIAFYGYRVAKWAERAEQIGVDPELIAELAEKTEIARAALIDQERAEAARRGKTEALKTAIAEMMTLGATALAKMRSKIAPPGEPHSFKATLSQIGEITLTWQCEQPRGSTGTTYEIYRRLGTTGKPQFIGASGVKRFVDETIPSGAGVVCYQVRAIRSTGAGPWANYEINLGVTGTRRRAGNAPGATMMLRRSRRSPIPPTAA